MEAALYFLTGQTVECLLWQDKLDLVIDHSLQVDQFGSKQAFAANALLEFERNQERYSFLRWGQTSFRNFR